MKETELFAKALNKKYKNFVEKSITNRRFKHKDIEIIINKLNKKIFEVNLIGKSTEERSIYSIKIGTGKTKVLLWSQMHGNEPTATQSLMDIFRFFSLKNEFETEKKIILENLTLYFVPMLNPDGTEIYKRRNALDIDLNRDALRLSANETRILKKLRDEVNADYGFNLHDQEIYYTAGDTQYPATISFLAPAFDFNKTIDKGRENTMKTIVLMNDILQKFIPNQIGKYKDDFMPNAFGDNMQKWGTNTILIESGGYKNDRERQYVRKLNFISILSGLYGISENAIQDFKIEEYFKIPDNKKDKILDIIIRNAKVLKNDNYYNVDIGIKTIEINNSDFSEFELKSEIFEIGDLSQHYAFEEIDGDNITIESDNENQLYIGANADFLLKKV